MQIDYVTLSGNVAATLRLSYLVNLARNSAEKCDKYEPI